ncbi:RNA polymerase ECF family sigma subunit [Flavobacteriaceae bacterium MAR_2010_72]|nr:RNA polymerase ECF family sigma subunit [Flavobacteriaceae bacterium MAR_2010_72]
MTSNDQIIINQVIDGNTNAFAVLVDRYKDLVFTLALRMMKHREEAEEVAQDTFIKVFKSLDKFKGGSKFSTWIYKVAYNSCLDKIKSNKRKYNEVEINNHTSNYIKTSNNAFDDLVEEERKQAIQECLNQLPSDDSFLLTLFYFEDQSLEEISSIIGLTPNNVKVKLFRARKKLAGILKERIEPELIEYYEKEHK